MTQVISSKQVKARKDHRCGYCDVVAIKAGEEYLRETYVGDGRVYTWVSCLACQRLFPQVWEWAGEPYDEGVGRDAFTEWAREVVRYSDTTWLARALAYLSRVGATVDGAS